MKKQRKKLTRSEMAKALTARGYKISGATLATKASRGGGPRFVKFNGRALYDPEEGFTWAESRILKPSK